MYSTLKLSSFYLFHLFRSLQLIEERSQLSTTISFNPSISPLSSISAALPSPYVLPSSSSIISSLLDLCPMSGKTNIMHSMICLRPSELYFILHHLSLRDLHSSSSSSSLIPPSSSQSKEVSDASQYIVASDLIQKLRNSVNTYNMSQHDTLSSTKNNMTADILSKYPSIIQSTSLYDRIQSSSSTTNSSSPSSPSSHLIEHTIDRDVSFIFYLIPHHHHHDYSSHFLNDSVTIMSHQKDNDGYSNDIHKGTKNEYVSFSKFNPSEVIPSSSSSSYSTTTIIFDEHQKQQEQQQHQDPPYYNNFNDYTTNNNNVMMINNINALANIKWLITASRTVLTSLYSIDKSNIYSSITNNHNTIHELQDLNTKLIKHKKDIFLIFQDIYKIQLCYNICMNYNSQLRLLINHYKKESDNSSRSSSDSSDYHRKVNEDNYSANADDDVVINLQNEYLHYDGVYLHWNPRNSDINISSTSSSTTNKIDNNARVNGSTNNNDDNYHNNISLDKDLYVYDIDKSLSRLILLQNQLESQLYHHHHNNNNNSNYNVNYNNQIQLSSNETKSNQSNNNHDDNNTTTNNNYFSSKLALLVNKTALFTSQQQQQPHHHQQDDHFHQLKHKQHSTSSDVVNIDSSIRTPNPLHAVMQSVFSSSSSSSLFT